MGNLAAGLVTPQILREFFDQSLVSIFEHFTAPGMLPVVRVDLGKDGKFAFVELRTPEMVTASLDLNGIALLGATLNISRPKKALA